MSEYRVLIAARTFGGDPGLAQRLVDAGCELVESRYGFDMSEDQLIEVLADVDGVIAGVQRFSRRVLEAAPRLKVIARSGVGVDAIDLEAATDLGIVVTNTPGANAIAVADYAFGLLLAVARQIPSADALVSSGQWGKRFVGVEVWGKTLGIAGLGRIGKGMALRGAGFGMTLLAYDTLPDRGFAAGHGITFVPFEELLERSDFVTLHLPATPETRGIMDARRLALMKPSAYLINTARGDLIDVDALADAIRSKRLAGAAIDVFPEEPPVGSPLIGLENVVLSPHNAAFTVEAIDRMASEAVTNLIAVLGGERALTPVNPEVYKRPN